MQVEHGIYTKDGEVKSTHFHQEMDEQAKGNFLRFHQDNTSIYSIKRRNISLTLIV
jgi:hypothetical protein